MAGQASTSRPSPPGACPQWLEGDIAFLTQSENMSSKDFEELISRQGNKGNRAGYIPWRATGHPVIVLKRLSEDSTHVLITPVSAYSWERNGRRPPWCQRQHQSKRQVDFRSFVGTERADDTRPFLRLQPGQTMPKNNSSWVYIQSVWAVPITALCVFTGSRTVLTVHPESLEDLRQHMAAECTSWDDGLRRLAAAAPAPAPAPVPHRRPGPKTDGPLQSRQEGGRKGRPLD
ncbi:uncharacterized protein C8A04DRAFT_27735 [Dichotomopilus funicola]|uniref:Uncharacterized protein n=1 Tax=Dichotomopilus funicola TaxID=1934379 RepID=A0AAN6ZNL1_9PEZI|nr:hypothetical protein C8A04DRAFT_27735 [Dichotomopilus funicola]